MGNDNRFSYQLYSSRKFGPPAETIAALGALGYAEAEACDSIYNHTEAMKAALDLAGMRMPSGHFALTQLELDPEACLAIAHRLGMSLIICPYLDVAERPTTPEGWHDFGTRLQKIAVWFGARDLTFCWHNHDFEFAPLADGSRPIAHLLDAAPDVGWQIDIAWLITAGEEPDPWIARYGSRIRSVHMKDIAPAGENLDQDGWTAIGQGTIDWARLLPLLRAAGCSHFAIEHDNPANDQTFAAVSIAAARSY